MTTNQASRGHILKASVSLVTMNFGGSSSGIFPTNGPVPWVAALCADMVGMNRVD